MDEINKKLEQIVETERQGIERRMDEGRQKVEQALADLAGLLHRARRETDLAAP